MAERLRVGKLTALSLSQLLFLSPTQPKALLLAMALLLSWAATAQAGDNPGDRYVNARYGYSIDVPQDVFTPQGESENGDGQVFLGDGGEASLTVWASHLLDETTVAEAAETWRQGRDVTYARVKDDWFILSGFEDGKIFYQKCIMRNGISYTFILSYPPAERGTYDALCGALAKSFKAP